MAKKKMGFVDNLAAETAGVTAELLSRPESDTREAPGDAAGRKKFVIKKEEKEERKVFSIALKKHRYDKLKNFAETSGVSMGKVIDQLIDDNL